MPIDISKAVLAKGVTPTKKHVLAARIRAGHTQQQAADTVYVDARTWQRWESGASSMAPAFYELYLAKAGGKLP